MAALAAGRAGARVILAEEDFRFGGRLLVRAARRSTASPRASGSRRALAELATLRQRAADAAHHRLRRLRRRHLWRGRARHRSLPVPPQHQPRQRSWRIVAKRAVLASGAIERRIVFAGNDRPGVMLGRRCGPISTASAWRRASAPSCSPATTTAGARRATLPPPASRSRPSSIPREADGIATQAAGRGRVFAGAVVERRRRRPARFAAVIVRDDKRRRDRDRLRSARGVQRLESDAASDLPSRRQAGLGRALAAFVPGAAAAGHDASPAPPPAISRLAEALRDGARLGAEAAQRLRLRCQPLPPMPPRRRGDARSPRRCGACAAARARPSSICRTT